MDNILSLIESAKSAQGIASDYGIAKALGISVQRMSRYRQGQNTTAEDGLIVKAAELAGMNPAVVLVDFHAARANGTAFYVWERLRSLASADTITRAALCAFMSLGMMFGLAANPAGTGLTSPFSAP